MFCSAISLARRWSSRRLFNVCLSVLKAKDKAENLSWNIQKLSLIYPVTSKRCHKYILKHLKNVTNLSSNIQKITKSYSKTFKHINFMNICLYRQGCQLPMEKSRDSIDVDQWVLRVSAKKFFQCIFLWFGEDHLRSICRYHSIMIHIGNQLQI